MIPAAVAEEGAVADSELTGEVVPERPAGEPRYIAIESAAGDSQDAKVGNGAAVTPRYVIG